MPEPIPFNLSGAQLPDSTIDFYTLLNEAPDASTEELRSKISAVYSEAQANRDHRNLTKRREYQALLELLPPARAALLEEPKRARYDDYLAKAKDGEAPLDFETFINDLMGLNEPMEEKTGLLGVQDKAAQPSVRSGDSNRTSAPKTPTTSRPVPQNRPASASSGASYSPSSRPAPSSNTGLAGAAIAFVVGALLGYLVSHHQILPTLLMGVFFAALAFVVLNTQGGKKIKR